MNGKKTHSSDREGLIARRDQDSPGYCAFVKELPPDPGASLRKLMEHIEVTMSTGLQTRT